MTQFSFLLDQTFPIVPISPWCWPGQHHPVSLHQATLSPSNPQVRDSVWRWDIQVRVDTGVYWGAHSLQCAECQLAGAVVWYDAATTVWCKLSCNNMTWRTSNMDHPWRGMNCKFLSMYTSSSLQKLNVNKLANMIKCIKQDSWKKFLCVFVFYCQVLKIFL